MSASATACANAAACVGQEMGRWCVCVCARARVCVCVCACVCACDGGPAWLAIGTARRTLRRAYGAGRQAASLCVAQFARSCSSFARAHRSAALATRSPLSSAKTPVQALMQQRWRQRLCLPQLLLRLVALKKVVFCRVLQLFLPSHASVARAVPCARVNTATHVRVRTTSRGRHFPASTVCQHGIPAGMVSQLGAQTAYACSRAAGLHCTAWHGTARSLARSYVARCCARIASSATGVVTVQV